MNVLRGDPSGVTLQGRWEGERDERTKRKSERRMEFRS